MRIRVSGLLFASMLSMGCGGTEDAATTATSDAPATVPSTDAPATTEEPLTAADVKLVKLELPGMTWGGCASSVRGALAGLVESGVITELKLTPGAGGGSGQFKCAKDADIAAKLTEAAEGNDHMAGFKIES